MADAAKLFESFTKEVASTKSFTWVWDRYIQYLLFVMGGLGVLAAAFLLAGPKATCFLPPALAINTNSSDYVVTWCSKEPATQKFVWLVFGTAFVLALPLVVYSAAKDTQLMQLMIPIKKNLEAQYKAIEDDMHKDMKNQIPHFFSNLGNWIRVTETHAHTIVTDASLRRRAIFPYLLSSPEEQAYEEFERVKQDKKKQDIAQVLKLLRITKTFCFDNACLMVGAHFERTTHKSCSWYLPYTLFGILHVGVVIAALIVYRTRWNPETLKIEKTHFECRGVPIINQTNLVYPTDSLFPDLISTGNSTYISNVTLMSVPQFNPVPADAIIPCTVPVIEGLWYIYYMTYAILVLLAVVNLYKFGMVLYLKNDLRFFKTAFFTANPDMTVIPSYQGYMSMRSRLVSIGTTMLHLNEVLRPRSHPLVLKSNPFSRYNQWAFAFICI